MLHGTILRYAVLLFIVSCSLVEDMQWSIFMQSFCKEDVQAHQDCLIMQVSCSLLHTGRYIASGLFNHTFHQPYQADQHLLHLQKQTHLQRMGIWLVGVPKLKKSNMDRPVELFASLVMQILKQRFACA